MNGPIKDGLLTAAFAKLGLAVDADARAVRQAYVRQLKQVDQTSEIQAFQALREAYELALAAAQLRVNGTARDAVPTSAPPAESVPAPPATELIDSTSLAGAALTDLTRQLAAGVASTAQAAALLQQARERLVSLQAGTQFEQGVADLLASGWQPGHEFLFDAACMAFGWEEDRSRLRSLAGSGFILLEALIERQDFFDQPDSVSARASSLLHRLRDAKPPSRTLLRDEQPLLRAMVRRYPHWLCVTTSRANTEQWLGGSEAFLAELAKPVPSQPAASSNRQFSDWQVVGFLLWVAFMAWYHFG